MKNIKLLTLTAAAVLSISYIAIAGSGHDHHNDNDHGHDHGQHVSHNESHGDNSHDDHAVSTIEFSSVLEAMKTLKETLSKVDNAIKNDNLEAIHNIYPDIEASASYLDDNAKPVSEEAADRFHTAVDQLMKLVKEMHDKSHNMNKDQTARLLKKSNGAVMLVENYMNHNDKEETDDQKLEIVGNEYVCMVNNKRFPNTQIPVEVNGKTYYGCCQMCKKKLKNSQEIREAKDPVSGNIVDKSSAVIGSASDGTVYYFENTDNFNKFGEH